MGLLGADFLVKQLVIPDKPTDITLAQSSISSGSHRPGLAPTSLNSGGRAGSVLIYTLMP